MKLDNGPFQKREAKQTYLEQQQCAKDSSVQKITDAKLYLLRKHSPLHSSRIYKAAHICRLLRHQHHSPPPQNPRNFHFMRDWQTSYTNIHLPLTRDLQSIKAKPPIRVTAISGLWFLILALHSHDMTRNQLDLIQSLYV